MLAAHVLEQIQGVYVSVVTTEIANAAYQVWLVHTSSADGIAVVCRERRLLVVGSLPSGVWCVEGTTIDPQML